MKDDTSEAKQFKATPHKLREARKKGQVVRTRDSVTAVVTVASVVTLWLEHESLTAGFIRMLELPFSSQPRPFAVAAYEAAAILGRMAMDLLTPVLIVVVIAAILASIVFMGGPVFAGEPLIPRFEKIDPVAGLKRLFGLQALSLFGITVIKVAMLLAALTIGLAYGLDALLKMPECGLDCAGPVFLAIARPLVVAACGIMLLWALVDLAVNRGFFLRDMRMTRTELRRERRDLEGEPVFKGRRRSLARQMVETGGGAKRATLVVADGVRTAAALRWVEGETPAPFLVAKGRGGRARQLLDLADRVAVPVLDEPDLAQALALTVDVGSYVTEALVTPTIAAFQRAGLR